MPKRIYPDDFTHREVNDARQYIHPKCYELAYKLKEFCETTFGDISVRLNVRYWIPIKDSTSSLDSLHFNMLIHYHRTTDTDFHGNLEDPAIRLLVGNEELALEPGERPKPMKLPAILDPDEKRWGFRAEDMKAVQG